MNHIVIGVIGVILMFILFLSTLYVVVTVIADLQDGKVTKETKICGWIATFSIFSACVYAGFKLFVFTFNIPI